MGKDRLVDKRISPLTTLTSLTPLTASAQRLGYLPIGNYKGAAAFFDLDKLANQPLAQAEQMHILGILDGREEDHDLQTVAFVAAEAIGTIHTAALTVPAGQVWIINAIETVLPASGGANIIAGNWTCSLWTDRAVTPSVTGQPFHVAGFQFGVGGGTQWDEFGVIPLLWAATNKPQALRLPAGTILTVAFTNTVAVVPVAVNCLFRIYGYIGKALVA